MDLLLLPWILNTEDSAGQGAGSSCLNSAFDKKVGTFESSFQPGIPWFNDSMKKLFQTHLKIHGDLMGKILTFSERTYCRLQRLCFTFVQLFKLGVPVSQKRKSRISLPLLLFWKYKGIWSKGQSWSRDPGSIPQMCYRWYELLR